jgi:hypothetical protein
MRNPKREIAVAVVGCAAAAGLALFAGSRTWLVETVTRPSPLAPTTTAHTGASLVPALAAAALVVLAGAGAVLATRGWGRRAVGSLIVVGGLGTSALALSQIGRDGVAVGWVVVTAAAGLVAAAGGLAAVRAASTWPSLGRRYERPSSQPYEGSGVGQPYERRLGRMPERAADDRTGGEEKSGEVASREFWDALDRGEDPTKS